MAHGTYFGDSEDDWYNLASNAHVDDGRFDYAAMTLAPDASVSGRGKLFDIELRALADGSIVIDLVDVKVGTNDVEIMVPEIVPLTADGASAPTEIGLDLEREDDLVDLDEAYASDSSDRLLIALAGSIVFLFGSGGGDFSGMVAP